MWGHIGLEGHVPHSGPSARGADVCREVTVQSLCWALVSAHQARAFVGLGVSGLTGGEGSPEALGESLSRGEGPVWRGLPAVRCPLGRTQASTLQVDSGLQWSGHRWGVAGLGL